MSETFFKTIVVGSAKQDFLFQFQIHQSENKGEQVIEPSFYEKEFGRVHEGAHHEAELIQSPIWDGSGLSAPVHIHVNPNTRRYFLCFSGQIKTLGSAETLLRIWCVGTVYTILHDEDFQPLQKEHGADFRQFMEQTYSIAVKEEV